MLPKKKIGYTLGDQSGIGPEVIRGALESGQLSRDVEYVLIGSHEKVEIGKPNLTSALLAFDHLELGAQALKAGEISALVTAPVCKETLHDVGFHFPGQTEFFADRLGVENYAMCLSGKHLTHGLSCSEARGIFRSQGSNCCPLHCKADS